MALTSRPPTDAEHFANYIRSTTEDNIRRTKKRYAHLTNGLEGGGAYRVARLITVLLSNSKSAAPALHTLVWFKARVLRLNPRRVDRTDLKKLCPRVDAAIVQLLEHEVWAPTFFDIQSDISIDVLPTDLVFPEHYDCASARRELWHAWLEFDCSFVASHRRNAIEIVDEVGRKAGPCFHAHNRRLLELLNEHAASEIEHNVLIAVGTNLPPELTELVFEYALAAEEIPQEPRVICSGDEATVPACSCTVVTE
jgi:hypothetical protein